MSHGMEMERDMVVVVVLLVVVVVGAVYTDNGVF